MNSRFDLLAFDLDGTLVDSVSEIADAVNDVLHQLSLQPVTDDQVARWVGNGTATTLLRALACRRGVGEATLANSEELLAARALFPRCYERHCGTRSRLYSGVIEALETFRGAGLAMSLVTNKEHRYTLALLHAHGLDPFFDPVISGDSLSRCKPWPDGLQACMERYGVPPSRTLFVGDSAIDVAAARAAGTTVWLLPHGYNQGASIESAEADRVLADFDALRVALAPDQPG
jgi:phosphoglycolate phosphatase